MESNDSGPATWRGQGKPAELPSLTAECIFVVICSMGQLLFAILLANTMVNQVTLVSALGISGSLSPWLIGSFLLANGVSVVVSGSLADIVNPKWLSVGACLVDHLELDWYLFHCTITNDIVFFRSGDAGSCSRYP